MNIITMDPQIMEKVFASPDINESRVYIDFPDFCDICKSAKIKSMDIKILYGRIVDGKTFDKLALELKHSKSTIWRRYKKNIDKLRKSNKIKELNEIYNNNIQGE
jgi:hypothetical protein